MKSEDQVPPRTCPTCGADLTEYPYAQIAPSSSARLLRRTALLLLPIMALAYLAQLFWGDANLGFGTGAGYYAVAWIGGPSFLVYAVSRLLPRVRRVVCLRCSWSREYPLARAA